MAQLQLKAIGKRFGTTDVLRDINMEIPNGQFAVFVGPSGCGKTTLLRMISGLEDISSGELLFDSEVCNDLAPVQRKIAMVFQSYALYPHMSVFENMAFGLRERRMPIDQIKVKVDEAAAILQIGHLLERRPKELSGGQKQRVAMGRAIVREPSVFLFDEPLSNLDASLRTQMRVELARLHERLGATMVYVTHDQVEAMTLADKIFVLNHGCLEQAGTPREIFARPRNRFVAEFIGSPKMNFIPCEKVSRDGDAIAATVQGHDAIRLDGSVISSADVSGARHLGVRPDSLLLAGAQDPGISARIASMEDLGSEILLYLECSFGEVIAKQPFSPDFSPGQEHRLMPQPGEWHLFDQDGTRIE